ncbi:MAG: hypothetical protein KAT65_06375 [Methanophagales archaeon]|nr:hypothetical protein [Methanophagales archaeon]
MDSEKNNEKETAEEKEGLGKNHLELTPKEWLFFLSSETSQRYSSIGNLFAYVAVLIALLFLWFTFGDFPPKPWIDPSMDLHTQILLLIIVILVILMFFIVVRYFTNNLREAYHENDCMNKIKEEILNGTLTASEEIYERWKGCKEY